LNTPPPTDALLAELQQASTTLEGAAPLEILQWAVEQYAPNFAMATAFGPEGMTMIYMLSQFSPETPIFNLDTGYQFQETLDLRDLVKSRYGMDVRLAKPELTVAQYEDLHGGPVYKSNPSQCCYDRKRSSQSADCRLGQKIRFDQSQPLSQFNQSRYLENDYRQRYPV
jgi:phosphoadenosine phosphosulfate reductase